MAKDYSLSVAAAMWRYAENCADKERRNTIMTTKTDITQERVAFEARFSKPPFEWEAHRYGEDSAWPGNYQNYDMQCAWEAWQARAAAEADRRARMHDKTSCVSDSAGSDRQADRKGRMPSDETLPDLLREALSWGRAWGRTISPQDWDELRDDQVAQLLSRYSSGQPAKPSNLGELGRLPGKSDQYGQPAASAEPPKRPYARSSTLGEYGIIPECDTQPATPASAQATIKESKIVGDELLPVFAFLLGEGPLRGVYFGDRHPDERGAFWWRKDLRAALAARRSAQVDRSTNPQGNPVGESAEKQGQTGGTGHED